jgi:hypothetical protein
MLNRPDIDQLNAEFSGANQCQKWASSLRYMDEIQVDKQIFIEKSETLSDGSKAANNRSEKSRRRAKRTRTR